MELSEDASGSRDAQRAIAGATKSQPSGDHQETRQQTHYLFLEDIILRHVQTLFPGFKVHGHWLFRVTRNSGVLDEESIPDAQGDGSRAG